MSSVIEALRNAVAALPDDIALRLHLAEEELEAGLVDDAVATVVAALAIDPTHVEARALMARAVAGHQVEAQEAAAPAADPPGGPVLAAPATVVDEAGRDGPGADRPAPAGFDWNTAEADLGSDTPPPFVDPPAVQVPVDSDPTEPVDRYLTERPRTTLADVGGMLDVKHRLTVSFLEPLRNPQLRALYGKSLRGGLLMYGPPGCGKTFIARAVAGELAAAFMSVSAADVLNRWLGEAERNLHNVFLQARRQAPTVVFLDELDTLGQRRSNATSSMAPVVNQLLTELDGFDDPNSGVFVLAATNQPWQIDPALRRPGRFDRTVLVLPPDEPARQAIFRHHLADRPISGIDLARLARLTDGLSGADIRLVCESATEAALMDSVASGEVRMITMPDLEKAAASVRPSIGPWLETARNIVEYGEDDGTFADLRAYLKKVGRI